jgi:hypothetical protein
LRFALFAAGWLKAVALMTQIAMIGTIESLQKAFAPGRDSSLGQLKKTGVALAARPILKAHQNNGTSQQNRKNSEQNQERFVLNQ